MYAEPTTAQEVIARYRAYRRPPAPPIVRLAVLSRPPLPVERDWLFVASKDKAPSVTPANGFTLLNIRRVVLHLSGISLEAFQSGRRTRDVIIVRFAYYWLARSHAKASYTQIGRFAGRRDHSTVMASFASKTMEMDEVTQLISRAVIILDSETGASPTTNFAGR